MLRANKPLKILMLFGAIFTFAASPIGPLYAIYVGLISDSVVAVTTTWSIFLISTTVFSFIVSRVGDKVVDKEYLLMSGWFIHALVWISYIFANNLIVVSVLQIFLGLGAALAAPVFGAMFAEHLDEGKHIEEYANWVIIVTALTAVGTFAGGFMVEAYGFTLLFVAMASLATISFLGLLIQSREML